MLIRDVAAGRLSDGERLPPERDMATSLQTSVGTLRKALAELEQRGMLERVQGSGNYIKAAGDLQGIYAFFRLELNDGGGLPTASLLQIEKLAKPEGLPQFGSAADAHRIRRLRLLDGRPAAVEEVWLDGSFAQSINQADISDSLYLYYRRSLGLWISQAEDRVGVGQVPDWAPHAFAPNPGEVVGLVERLSRAQDGQLAEFSRTWFDANIARYVSRMR